MNNPYEQVMQVLDEMQAFATCKCDTRFGRRVRNAREVAETEFTNLGANDLELFDGKLMRQC